jgi:prepilin-type N-terminal cleavage/methylation domain-containing protein
MMLGLRGRNSQSGFTLIELMVVGAVLLVLVTLSAPSIRDMIGSQRLQSVSAALVADIQFARSEAVRRQLQLSMVVSGNSEQSCYVLFYEDNAFGGGNCNCLRPADRICTNRDQELRSLSLPVSTGLTLRAASSNNNRVNFFPAPQTPLGSTLPRYIDPVDWQVELSSSDLGTLRTSVNAAGVISTCSPDGSVKRVARC